MLTPAQAAAAPVLIQSGTCFTDYAISITSCEYVRQVCSSSVCSTFDGAIHYECLSPHSCTGTVHALPLFSTAARALAESYYGYDQSGSCYTDHDMQVASCSDVQRLCTTSSCTTSEDQITFACATEEFACSGVASIPTQSPTPLTTSPPRDCVRDLNLLLTTCADSSPPLQAIGCTCFTCVEAEGHISVSCTAPFTCVSTFDSSTAVETEDFRLKANDYAAITLVYVTAVCVVATAVWVLSPTTTVQDPLKSKLTLVQEAVVVCNPCTALFFALETLVTAVWSFVIEPNKRADGSMTTLREFAVSTDPWIALFFRGCCSSRVMRAPAAMSVSRGVVLLAFDTSLAISLAFLVGTAVNMSEPCYSLINTEYCQSSNGATPTTMPPIESSGPCPAVALRKLTHATLFIVVLTKVVSATCSAVDRAVVDPTKRAAQMRVGRLLLMAVLLAFGVGYSFQLTARTSDAKVAQRQYTTVGTVLAIAWVLDHTSAFGLMLLRRVVGVFIVWVEQKQHQERKSEQPGGSTVLPVETVQPPTQQPLSGEIDPAAVRLSGQFKPSAPEFAMMLDAADGADAVTLADPVQPQWKLELLHQLADLLEVPGFTTLPE